FESGEMLLENIKNLQLDLIVMDISLPGIDGIETIARLRSGGCTFPILCLSMHLNQAIMNRAFKAGANGYVVKHDPFDVLSDGIRSVSDGNRFISPAMSAGHLNQNNSQETLAILSPREREILLLVADGRTALDIAGQLGISERTVDFHRRRIGEKTGLKRIPDIVKFVHDNGSENRR
ncbi:MAG: response regulator transcription factor, partial [Hyphomicrobiales bacterium]